MNQNLEHNVVRSDAPMVINRGERPIPFDGNLRAEALRIPQVIRKCTGIFVFGKRIKSLVFSTDLAIIKNVDADAVFAVHPFTPQPTITNAILASADIPVFAGVGGGSTLGSRMVQMAISAESQGAVGVVVNTKGKNETIAKLHEFLEIPVVITVIMKGEDIQSRIENGASIINGVCCGADTGGRGGNSRTISENPDHRHRRSHR